MKSRKLMRKENPKATLNDKRTISVLSLRNRLVLPSITTNYRSSKGLITTDVLGFYGERPGSRGLPLSSPSRFRSPAKGPQGAGPNGTAFQE